MKIGNIHHLGYRLLGDRLLRFFPLKGLVRKSLNTAHLRISHIIYISSMTFWMIIGMSLAAGISFPLLYLLNSFNVLPAMLPWFIYPIAVTLGAGGIVLAVFLYYPYSLSSTMKKEIDRNIVYIINYMSILAGAGVTTEALFTSLAIKGETYKIQGSAKAIVRDIEILGKDIISAVDDESNNTPSRKFSKLLLGLNGITRTGGNLQRYLRETANRQMDVRRRELSKLVAQLNLAAEAYIVLGIAFPVILTTLLSMMGVFGGDVLGGLSPVQIMTLMTYVFFPLAGVGVLLLIDGMTSSW